MSDQPMTKTMLLQKPNELMQYLTRAKPQVSMALPKHLNVDRMLRLAVTCFSNQKGLRDCTPQSILASIIVASQIGLEPGIAGQGYLIPYKDRRKNISICTFIPGWQGLVALLNNTGRATAWTGAVFEGDVFKVSLGSKQEIQHEPGANYGDLAKLSWVYACGKVNGAELPVIEAWPMSRIWRHRDRFNKVGREHYSFEHPEMYARKVVLLQVLKYMPKSIELQNAMTAAEAVEEGKIVGVADPGAGGVVFEAETMGPEGEGQAGEAGNVNGGGQQTPQSPFRPQEQASSSVSQAGPGNGATATAAQQQPQGSQAPAAADTQAAPNSDLFGGGGQTIAPDPSATPLAKLRSLMTEGGVADAEVLMACQQLRVPCGETLDATPVGSINTMVGDFENLKAYVENKVRPAMTKEKSKASSKKEAPAKS